MTTPPAPGRVVKTSIPSAVVRPSASEPSPTSRDAEPREDTLDTRALARALREQRVVIVESRSIPGGTYAIVKVKDPGQGMDPRVKDALLRIRAQYPKLSRRQLARAGGVGYQITAEGYKGALALLSALLHPRARGEAPRWLPGVTAAQVSATIDGLLKTVNR